MLDLATATLENFSPHIGSAFRLDHPEDEETFTLVEVKEHPNSNRAGGAFDLIFNGSRTDVKFDQQILPLEHAAIGKMHLFLVPVGQNTNGTIRYQAVFN